MAWSTSTVSAANQAARAEDFPLVLARNILRGTAIKWTVDGDHGSPDITDPALPTYRLYDGQLFRSTAHEAGTATIHYLNISLSSAALFDAVFIKLGGSDLLDYVEVRLVISNTDDFASPTTIATWSAPEGNARLLSTSLGAGHASYSGTGYVRVELEYASDNIAPVVTEMVLARRRQLANPLDFGGYDDIPIGSRYVDSMAAGHVAARQMMAGGFRDLGDAITTSRAELSGIDGIAVVRDMVRDARNGRDPVVWVDWPLSRGVDSVVFGHLDIVSSNGLVLEYTDWTERRGKMGVLEGPPFIVALPLEDDPAAEPAVVTGCAVFNGTTSVLTLDCSTDDPFTGLTEWTVLADFEADSTGSSLWWVCGRSVSADAEMSMSVSAGQLAVNILTSTGTYAWSITSPAIVPTDDLDHRMVLRMQAASPHLRCWVDGVELTVTETPGTGTYEPIGDALGDWSIGWLDVIGFVDDDCLGRQMFWGSALSAAACLAMSTLSAAAPTGAVYDLRMHGNANDSSGNGRNFANTAVTFT